MQGGIVDLAVSIYYRKRFIKLHVKTEAKLFELAHVSALIGAFACNGASDLNQHPCHLKSEV